MRLSLMLAVTTLVACGGGSGSAPTTPTPTPTPTPIATSSVSLQNTSFDPASIVVSPSTVVTFTNNDGILHNVTFADQTVTSIGDWATGSRTVTMPATVGTYSYHCTIHNGMNGTVKVQ